ncbi:bile acid:sodium symporter family protein [Mycobacterium sp. OTB74]|uniref:bile acid:sodium symporter family protein n=1 Tax=Mycobacterium sp. OTB74 TaxID=1853452 RepID=UPI0024762A53|nr:bile acid:sodium symporter family protein [Mycobacterium sp. OTB74]MDH6243710.1 sodium/bile acid cotransporter 7 [Mycobacterium sp. OTB74]
MNLLAKLRIDGFLLGLFVVMAIGVFLPAPGEAGQMVETATKIAIAVLFLLYGTRLEPREALEGLKHWRLHTTVLAATYVLFPLLGLAMKVLVPSVLTVDLYTGMLYLCLLPSTVQSSIAFTSIARGNVAAAVVSASASNMLGIFVTPLLVTLLMQTSGGATVSAKSILEIVVQLLLPFIAGQLLRSKLQGVLAHTTLTKVVDRGSVYLVVYAAFSAGMAEHIWTGMKVSSILAVVAVSVVLLAVVLGVTAGAARVLGFDRADRIVIIFCGSKKSLATGLPMATVLFAGHPVGLIVLPLMIFHQIQLITCAWLSGRWGRQAEALEGSESELVAPA